MGKELHKPGTDNLPKGEYREVGPRGGEVPHARQVTIDQETVFHQHRKKVVNGKKFNFHFPRESLSKLALKL